VIVRFNLDCYSVALVKLYYACVVFKDGKAPFWFDFFGGFCNVGFEKAIDLFSVESYFSFEGFVATVFRPCLPDGLKLDIRGVAPLFLEVTLDCSMLGRVLGSLLAVARP
jgi:hypothetical protein